uniref:histidine kinase n=1 Tax=Thermosporothrix sp. COM3 TaxID=2490863 RepID=A0A455SRF6_9CHLR|nr:hypothetical protein KTC_25050 [Thermosporothrix sp. COM3]
MVEQSGFFSLFTTEQSGQAKAEAALFETLQDAVLVCDAQYRLSFWSKQAEALYGWTAEEALGQDVRELLHRQLIHADKDEEQCLFRDHSTWEAELFHRTKSGEHIIVACRSSLISGNEHLFLLEAHHDITSQRQREQVLEEYYRRVRKAIDIGVWRWEFRRDEQGHLHRDGVVNSRMAHLLHVPAHTHLSEEQFFAFIHPDDRPAVEQAIEHTLRTGEDYQATYRLLDEAQGERWIASRGSLVTDQQGTPLYAVGIALDITTQKQMEAALQQANRRVTSILEHVADGCIHIDNEWRCTYASKRAEEITGLLRQNLLHKSIWETLPELRHTEVEQYLRLAQETRQPVNYEMFFERTQQWFEVYVLPEDNYLALYYRDITELKNIESLYRERDEMLRRLSDANLICIASSTEADDILDANDAFLSLIGATREELQAGKLNFRALTPIEYRSLDREKHALCRATGVCPPYEKEYYHKRGHRVPILVAAAYMDRSQHYIALIMDITKQKELEKQREVFLGIIGHELRTPLTAIAGSLQLARRRLQRFGTQQPVTDNIAAILHSTDHLLDQSLRQTRVQNRLIEDLLDASRLAIDKLELMLAPVNLDELVGSTVEDLRSTAADRPLELRLLGKPLPVYIDAARIAQVLSNYITNALKYSPPEEPVTIEITATDNEARVWVHDHGPGLSEEARQKIWSRFQRSTDLKTQGRLGGDLGLGLYICQSLIQRHHGMVGVESEEGKGASFWFSLPLTSVPEKL